MKIMSLSDTLPPNVKTVVTVGNFDGVHRGHSRLIARAAGLARETGAASAAVTFEPHTRSVVYPELSTKLLTTFEEKCALMEELGVDYVFLADFDENFRRMEQEEFIEKVLVGKLRAVGWVMGEGHSVGQNLTGAKKNLHFAVGKYHINVFAEPLEATGDGAAISSTRIRGLISEGRVECAAAMLGRPYLIMAERAGGVKVATKLGYPTMNFRSPSAQKVIPPAGVYVAEIEVCGKIGIGGGGIDVRAVGGNGGDRYSGDGGAVGSRSSIGGGAVGQKGEPGSESQKIAGALYFGDCPTYSGRETHFEFHALRFGDDDKKREPAVGETVRLRLHKYIRPDTAFGSEDALKARIASDINEIKKYFSEETQ